MGAMTLLDSLMSPTLQDLLLRGFAVIALALALVVLVEIGCLLGALIADGAGGPGQQRKRGV